MELDSNILVLDNKSLEVFGLSEQKCTIRLLLNFNSKKVLKITKMFKREGSIELGDQAKNQFSREKKYHSSKRAPL